MLDFKPVYESEGLETLEQKIAFLTKELGIIFSIPEGEETLEEELLGLEELAEVCPWHQSPKLKALLNTPIDTEEEKLIQELNAVMSEGGRMAKIFSRAEDMKLEAGGPVFTGKVLADSLKRFNETMDLPEVKAFLNGKEPED